MHTSRRERSPSSAAVHLVTTLAAQLLLAGCLRDPDASGEASHGQTLTVRGSDTMIILAQRWAEAFMKLHPEATIQVSGGGSGVGLTALIDGTTDIANASRAIEASERKRVLAEHGEAAVETPVALDTIALYVHRSNPVPSLTLAETQRLYRGKVTSWATLGWEDRPVVLYSRENSSGTYAYFKEHVLEHGDFAAETQTLPGTAAVIHAVRQDENAIGYGGIGFGEGVRIVPIERSDGNVVAADAGAVKSGDYPLSRPLFMYTVGAPQGLAQAYIEFARSPDGQRFVEELGYFPLSLEEEL